MRSVLVAGARPQFVKAAALLPALRDRGKTLFLHTGQHRDSNMVEAHFEGLGLPRPDLRLDVEEQDRAARMAAMQEQMAPLLEVFGPDRVVVVGDTDSTLAAARIASVLDLSVAHVEAGARSGEADLVEEAIRIEVDTISELLLCSTQAHADNLAGREGVHLVGDVMADVLLAQREQIRGRIPVGRGAYGVLTLHRAATADDPAAVRRVLHAAAGAGVPVVFPKHPRTVVEEAPEGVELCEPMAYLDFLGLVSGARFVLTDSGGLQKEACMLEVPCITLREATEWNETVEAGWNLLAGTDPERIAAALRDPPRGSAGTALYGDGGAARRIATRL